MTSRLSCRLLVVGMFLVAAVGSLSGQDPTTLVGVAERGPRFLSGIGPSAGFVNPTGIVALRRRVVLPAGEVTVEAALREIARQTGVRLQYSRDVVPLEARVRLEASRMSLAAALTEVLLEARVDVAVVGGEEFVLVKQQGMVRRPQSGVIAGRVTDAKSGEGLPGADVLIEGTRWRASTGVDGRYRLAAVEAGSYTLAVRRIGYRRETRAVTVTDGEEVTVNVALEEQPTQLNEIVTTVTGDQRRVELGHVVGRINADSLVKEAPVSSLGELLNGRVPGLQVHTYQGTVGGEVNLRVRGPNTIQLGMEPIVIVDGVRYTSTAVPVESFGLTNNLVEPTSPLNDLNPNDIETIEVVKGPSAATLYGTDAVNGVIVITTKRGRPGPARWNAYVRGAATEIPNVQYQDRYWGWQTVGGVPSVTTPCILASVASGSCTQDSITVLENPLNDPQRTLFTSKPRWEYGANVAGGSQALRYFFSGDFERATGPVRMPPGVVDSLALLQGVRELPEEQREPNALSKLNLRSNVTAGIGHAAELQVTAGYNHRATRTLSIDNPYSSSSASIQTPDRAYGATGPAQFFSRKTTERVSRFFGSVAGRWSPTTWLLVRGRGGVDLSSITRSTLFPSDDARPLFSEGAVTDDRGRQLVTSGEAAVAATFSSGRFSSRTSVGAQYVRTLDDLVGSFGRGLPPGGSSIGEAASVETRQNYREQVALGSYLEQQVGLNQRLFLTGALRADGASTFGRDYDVAVYPKASLSWLISEEPFLPHLPGVDELRLRYAFGASGQQPRPEWARPGYAVRQVFYDGAATSVLTVTTLGNSNLRPERVREHEFGFDASALNNRVDIGLTWYRRTAVDQIVDVTVPPGLGYTMQTNLGLTTGRGFEAQLGVRPLDGRAVSWSLSLQHSFHTTTLKDLGGAERPGPRQAPLGGWAEGYSLGARFMIPLLGFDDANGDGIVTRGELQRGDTLVYVGESTPPRSQVLTSTVSLFDSRLRLSALVERRSGFTQVNRLAGDQCRFARCRAAVDPNTPLAEQAVAAALAASDYYLIEPGDFTRLREVSVAVDLPVGAVRALRLRSATLSLQARNLALWTSYGGADPESASPALGAAEAIGIPQGRSWVVRFDLGL